MDSTFLSGQLGSPDVRQLDQCFITIEGLSNHNKYCKIRGLSKVPPGSFEHPTLNSLNFEEYSYSRLWKKSVRNIK